MGLIVPYSLFREKQYRDKIAVSVKVKSKKGNYLFFHKWNALVLLCSCVLVLSCSCEDKMQDLPIVKRSIAMSQYWNTIMPAAHETEKVLNQVLILLLFARQSTRRSTTGCRNIHSRISRYLISHKILSHFHSLSDQHFNLYCLSDQWVSLLASSFLYII